MLDRAVKRVVSRRLTAFALSVAAAVAACSSGGGTPPEEFALINETVGFYGPSDTTFAGTVEVQFLESARIVDATPIVEGDAIATIVGLSDCSRGCPGIGSYEQPETEPLTTGSPTLEMPFDVPDDLDDQGSINVVMTLRAREPTSQTRRCIRIVGFEFHTADGRTIRLIDHDFVPMAIDLNAARTGEVCPTETDLG